MSTMLVTLVEPSLSAISAAGPRLREGEVCGQMIAIVKDESAGRDLVGKLAQGDFVHRDENVGMRDKRRTDAFLRQADVAVRAARAHLGTVRGKPADFEALAHAHLGEQLPEQEDALSAEARDLDGVVAEMMRMFRQSWKGGFVLGADPEHVADETLRRSVVQREFGFVVAEDVERERGHQLLQYPAAGLDRIFAPDGGAGGKNLDEGEAEAVALILKSAAHGAAGFHDVLVVGKRDALDVDRGFEGGEEF
jgi:hypothetical protein